MLWMCAQAREASMQAKYLTYLHDSWPNHSSPLMPMNVRSTFRVGSSGSLLPHGNSYQLREA